MAKAEVPVTVTIDGQDTLRAVADRLDRIEAKLDQALLQFGSIRVGRHLSEADLAGIRERWAALPKADINPLG